MSARSRGQVQEFHEYLDGFSRNELVPAACAQGGGTSGRVHSVGAQDASYSRIHSTNESVDLRDLERFIVAQSLLLQILGERRGGGRCYLITKILFLRMDDYF
jgi:hypothetical protein